MGPKIIQVKIQKMQSKIVKIASKQAGLKAKSANPRFNYYFEKANEPVEVEEEHAKKILRNPTFYEVGKVKKGNK